jgi:hypothetical protein
MVFILNFLKLALKYASFCWVIIIAQCRYSAV